MKKLILVFALLGFFYIIAPSKETLAKVSISPTKAAVETSAVAKAMADRSAGEQESATQSSEVKVEYSLPYPGILPDNPLHFLKAIRDRIILILISDPIKEAEFNLLTSDKRIYAAQLLSDKGKGELAVTTLSKSNNYFHNAISSVSEAKKMGKRVDIVLNSMKKSIDKHQEVLSMMKKNLEKAFTSQLQIEEKKMSDFEKSTDGLLLK